MIPTNGVGSKWRLTPAKDVDAAVGPSQVASTSGALSELLPLHSAPQDPQPCSGRVASDLFSSFSHSSEPRPGGKQDSCWLAFQWRLLFCLHINMHLVLFLKTTSPMMGWKFTGSTAGKWREESGPYRLGKSSLHFPT